MNVWTMLCLLMGLTFGIMALIFMLLKEKGAVLISGFNSLSKEEREQYDTKWMMHDIRNLFLIWTAVLLLGAVLSYFLSDYCGLISILVWVVLFLKNMHLNLDKAFGKYKKQP